MSNFRITKIKNLPANFVLKCKFAKKNPLNIIIKLKNYTIYYNHFCINYCSLSRKDAVQRHESTCTNNPGKITKPNVKVEEETFLTHRERLQMKLEKSQSSSKI